MENITDQQKYFSNNNIDINKKIFHHSRKKMHMFMILRSEGIETHIRTLALSALSVLRVGKKKQTQKSEPNQTEPNVSGLILGYSKF